MSRKVFRVLVTVEEAKSRLLKEFTPKPIETEVVQLGHAHRRVIARDVEAPIDVPPFDRASMDGFAVRAADTFGADEEDPRTLRIVDVTGAGEVSKVEVKEGDAVEVSTGAPIPRGSNAVLMVEYTSTKEKVIDIYRPVAPGENIMSAGSDIMAGELILRRGTFLTPRETGVLAAMGVTEVEVFKKPKVGVISTGNEIVPPGGRLDYGKIYDINARTISDSVAENGGEPIQLGIVEDDQEAMRTKIRKALEACDMVITSGGTSAGAGDLLYRVIDELGEPGIIVHGVSVKPGKPTIIAVLEGKPLFGLPGYPASALTIFDVFVCPVLREMAGLEPEVERKAVNAITAERFFTTGGRREYTPVNIVKSGSREFTVYPVPGGSGAITSLAEADGFIEIPENRQFLESGENVTVRLFSHELKPADLTIIGSHCLGIDAILELLRMRSPGITVKVINVGSSGGLAAVRRGEADIAGTHLLDDVSGDYNVPFIERFGIADKAVLIRGYEREQGFIVKKGNPEGVQGIMDLLRGDLSFINRNPGSGTRVLLDSMLKGVAEEKDLDFEQTKSSIQGYGVEAKSHSAVAVAVLQGKADLGLGIRTVANRYELDFIPVSKEQFDFAISVDKLGREAVQSFLETLRSEDFKTMILNRVPGIIPTNETGRTVYTPEKGKGKLQ